VFRFYNFILELTVMRKTVFTAAMVFLLLGAASAWAGDVSGEQLVRDLWSNMKANHWQKLDKAMSPAFQSVHSDGARDRAQELKLIKGLKMGDYTLDKFKTTRQGPVLVVTYQVTVSETIDGKRLTHKPAPRLTVFFKAAGGWQWLAHANLRPLEK
jgi:hypothetical protein